jgi:hypothetical protein
MTDDLDDLIREDLARLRARSGPSEAAKRRMWAALETRLGPGPPDDPGGEVPPDLGSTGAGSGAGGLGQAGFAAKVVSATVAMTGAGLLSLRLGVVALRSVAPEDPVEVVEATRESMPAPVVSATDASVVAPPSTPPVGEVAPMTKRVRARASASAEKSADRSLSAELELLQTAHDASSPQAMLTALDAHLQRFPTGQLADERDLLRVEALCKLGRLEVARTIAEDLRRRAPAVASRVREVCPAFDE